MGWIKQFPALYHIEDVRLRSELENTQRCCFPKGTSLFREGDACKGYVLVLKGSIRVFKIDMEGREILLYRVMENQSCMLTTTCLLGEQPYPAEGVVEQDVELIFLTPDTFERLLASKSFRQYAMAHIGERICDMMLLIEDVAFGRMDMRLCRVLLARQDEEDDYIRCTHQELASELGTAREVVSRLLKGLESRGWVALSRGMIQIRSIEQLKKMAESDTV